MGKKDANRGGGEDFSRAESPLSGSFCVHMPSTPIWPADDDRADSSRGRYASPPKRIDPLPGNRRIWSTRSTGIESGSNSRHPRDATWIATRASTVLSRTKILDCMLHDEIITSNIRSRDTEIRVALFYPILYHYKIIKLIRYVCTSENWNRYKSGMYIFRWELPISI